MLSSVFLFLQTLFRLYNSCKLLYNYVKEKGCKVGGFALSRGSSKKGLKVLILCKVVLRLLGVVKAIISWLTSLAPASKRFNDGATL